MSSGINCTRSTGIDNQHSNILSFRLCSIYSFLNATEILTIIPCGNIHGHILFVQWKNAYLMKFTARTFGNLFQVCEGNGGSFHQKYSSQTYTMKILRLGVYQIYLFILHQNLLIGNAEEKHNCYQRFLLCATIIWFPNYFVHEAVSSLSIDVDNSSWTFCCICPYQNNSSIHLIKNYKH